MTRIASVVLPALAALALQAAAVASDDDAPDLVLAREAALCQTSTDVSIRDLLTGLYDFQPTRLVGRVRDAVTTETRARWTILTICDRRDRIFASVRMPEYVTPLDHLVGKRIAAVGFCRPRILAPRRWAEPNFVIASPESITVLQDEAREETLPDVGDIDCACPEEILSLGYHQATGTVIAVWGDDSAVIRTETEYVGLKFLSTPLPTCGQTIRAVGLPVTDLYRINLARASWSAVPSVPTPETAAECISPAKFFSNDPSGLRVYNHYFGQTICLRGTILNVSETGRKGILHLESDGQTFTADTSSCPSVLARLSPGTVVDLTGICILDSPDLYNTLTFPRLQNFLLVVRTPHDIHVISRPPWWTPARLSIAVALLLLFLVAILVWNATLRRVVRRKSTALLKEQTAKLEETLKLEERTRLAAELHDYLAQNLTVVSYQLSSAQNALLTKHPDATQFLENANLMLQSCRMDLRRCLWDLKSDTLSEPDFTKAVLKTTALVAGDATVRVRFDIRRTRLTDTTAHAILSICRELVSNAAQHGKAKTVRIAGEEKNGEIRFSVRDNGCGFDPAHRPGPGQGHFGLNGIIERIKRLGGQFEIKSSPGSRTRIIVTIHNRENK